MQSNRMSRFLVLTGAVMVGALLSGCGAGNALPTEVPVELPDGQVVQAQLGEGAPSLANSSWTFFEQVPGGERAVVVMTFGPDGNIELFENSAIASELLGDELILDGQSHPTGYSGLNYAAATYGGENDSGLAFEARVIVTAGPVRAGNATATAIATFLDNDTMEGNLSFYGSVTAAAEPFLPAGTPSVYEESYDFIARRN
jgi:hypothetical protein